MERVVEEREYVLGILQRMRDVVIANPHLFEPDARSRIDQAIALFQTETVDVKVA